MRYDIIMTKEEMIDEIDTYTDEYPNQVDEIEDILFTHNPSGDEFSTFSEYYDTMSIEDLMSALFEIREIVGVSLDDIEYFVSEKINESSLDKKDKNAIISLIATLLRDTDLDSTDLLRVMKLTNEDILGY